MLFQRRWLPQVKGQGIYAFVTRMEHSDELRKNNGSSSVAPDYNKDGAKDDSPKKKAKKGRTNKTLQTGTRKSPRFPSGSVMTSSDLQDTAASNLHLERRPYSSGGWSGKIGIGLINGTSVRVPQHSCSAADERDVLAAFDGLSWQMHQMLPMD